MKKIISLSITLMMFVSNAICITHIPESILKKFNQKFPNATEVKWRKENSKEYEANFFLNGIKYSTNYNINGDWLETESEIFFKDLPEVIRDAFYKKFGKETIIKSVEKIEKNDSSVNYEIEYKSSIKKREIIFDSKGKIIFS